jgi:hypothetical protein
VGDREDGSERPLGVPVAGGNDGKGVMLWWSQLMRTPLEPAHR